MLEIPITLRVPRVDEIPNLPKVLDNIKAREKANIVEGFILKNNETNELPFKFYAKINVNNSRLWNLVIALSETLPEISSLLFGFIETEVNYGNYENKAEIINFIKQYKTELTQDTFLYFGLIYQDKEKLTEIFVNESKFIQYWGINEDLFRIIMQNFELDEVENLEFIDEYPKVRENLKLHNQNVLETGELIEVLKKKYF